MNKHAKLILMLDVFLWWHLFAKSKYVCYINAVISSGRGRKLHWLQGKLSAAAGYKLQRLANCDSSAVKRWTTTFRFTAAVHKLPSRAVYNAVGAHLQLCFCYLGANVSEKDRCGCNFLHLAILQPKGLKNIPEEVLQVPTSQCFLFTAHQTRCALPRHRCL